MESYPASWGTSTGTETSPTSFPFLTLEYLTGALVKHLPHAINNGPKSEYDWMASCQGLIKLLGWE